MNCLGRRTRRVGIVVVVSLLLVAEVWAEPVDLSQVQKATDGFLKVKTTQAGRGPGAIAAQGVGATPAGFREIRGDDGTLLAYVADLEPRGFVALAADTDLGPIVAYSFRSSFPRGADKRNPLYRMLREDMRLRLKALAEHPELRTAQAGRQWDLYANGSPGVSADGHTGTLQASAFQQWPPEGTTSTGGWLETTWQQGPPYNQFCPLDPVDGARSYVGCAATAMAQVLNYQRRCHIAFGPADSYVMPSGIHVDADSSLYGFPSFEVLNRYVGAIQSRYNAGVDLNDVEAAALSFACGVAVQMEYGSDGSGASPYAMQSALLQKFGLYGTDMFGGLAAESCLVLQENIINRLPALVCLGPADGFGGHVVVCDGYNTDGEYHISYGWGAARPTQVTEAWYRLPKDFYPDYYVVTETMLNVQPREPALRTNPASLSFYGVPGQDSEPQVLRLENSVGGVRVDAISSPDGFVIAQAGEFSNQIPSFALARPKQNASLRVRFRPQRAGGYYGTLAFHYNDGNVRYVILQGWSFDSGTQVTVDNASGTWSRDKSPYFVGANLQVPENGELVIEPGVKVFFTGHYSLTVGEKAKLTALGTAADPIEFTAWNREVGWAGLRLLSSGSDDVLRYCSLSWARKTAGFIPTDPNDPALVQEADSHGGAIYCYVSDPTIKNCRLTNNMGDAGGAIYCEYSFPVVSNTLIANNTSAGGRVRCGGICAYQYGTPELRNCTIVNNFPGGVFAGSWDGMNVTNTIVWGNETYQILTDESAPAVTFCDVQGGYPGLGNVSADPCFFRPSAGTGLEYDGSAANWALQSGSPCLNAGTQMQDLAAADLAGAARIASGVIDLGAFENQSELPLLTISPSRTADAGFVQLNANSTIHLSLTNTGKQDFKVLGLDLGTRDKAFSLPTPIVNRVLAPGESVPVDVAFTPLGESPYRGKLTVRSTASNGAQVAIALQGVGILGTVVPAGAVSGTWTKAAGPYVVTGDIKILQSKTLTIEPGGTVKFAGHFGLTVGYRGTLQAIGTPQDPIVFTAINKTEGWYGIRLINSAADDTLQFCTLEYAKKPRTGGGGVTNLYGGAILCYGSYDDDPGFPMPTSPKIDSCVIAHNYALVGGAIACLGESEAILTRNTIIDNTADYYGGGIALYFSWGTIGNNVIARNSALGGGGLWNVGSSPSITSNTIVYNRPSGLDLESELVSFFGPAQSAPVVNNVIWNNEIYLSEGASPDAFKICFNDVQGSWDGQGNIDKDPLFANPEEDDYHLRSQAGRWDLAGGTWVVDSVTSPCIDAGDPASDVGPEPQPNGQRINLGAYGGTDQASKSPGS